MHPCDDLEALRGNRPAQRRAHDRLQAAAETWWRTAEMVSVREELVAFAGGATLLACPALQRLLDDAKVATSALECLVASLAAALREEPFGHVPFRHQAGEGKAILQLAQTRNAALTLVAYDGATPIQPVEAISFSDGEGCELVLAGAADLTMAALVEESAGHASIDYEPRRIVSGERLQFGPKDARIVEQVYGTLVVLRLARTPTAAGPSRAFRMRDGVLLHRASGNRAESHRELAIALLGRMGRHDAAPLLAELAGEGSDQFRWHALRECLALDTASGFAALGAIARDESDPLFMPAASLRAQLIERHPQLARLETTSCPA